MRGNEPTPEYRSAPESVSIKTVFHTCLPRSVSRRLFYLCSFLPLIVFAPIGLGAQEGQEEGQEERIDSPYRWIPRGLRVGWQAGYHLADRGDLEFGQGSALAMGARFRVRVSSPLSLELGAVYAPANRWVVDPRLETGPAVVDTVSSGWLRLDVGVQLGLTGSRTWNGFHPYALFGGGFVIGLNEEISDTFGAQELEPFQYKIGTAPELFTGLGVEVFPGGGKIGIGFEARDYLVRVKTPDAFFFPDILDTIEAAGAEAPTDTQWGHNLEFAVVLWYYF
jgi:hypothetical protein